MGGNTQACRVKHLELAQSDAATHCPHASPNGGGECISAFCKDYKSTCSGVSGYVAYDSDCDAQFGKFAAGIKDDLKGNTQACRVKHLELAQTTCSAETYCFEGFVMDQFCIGRTTLLDNSNV